MARKKAERDRGRNERDAVEDDEDDEDDDDDEDDEDDDDDDDEGVEVSERDFVMARLAAARNSLQATIDNVDECIALFVNPDEDKTGKKREKLLDDALETVGVASRCLESADEVIGEIDPAEGEPWEE